MERDLRDIALPRSCQRCRGCCACSQPTPPSSWTHRKLAVDLQISDKTVRAYVELLRTVFLVHVVPAWRPGLRSRELHTPKLYLADTGLLAQQLGVDKANRRGRSGDRLCARDLLRHGDPQAPELGHRAFHPPPLPRHNDEIDIVLESQAGDLAAIEVKARASIRESDWRVMRHLRDSRPDLFKAGVVLYTGRQTIPLGDRIWAVPIQRALELMPRTRGTEAPRPRALKPHQPAWIRPKTVTRPSGPILCKY